MDLSLDSIADLLLVRTHTGYLAFLGLIVLAALLLTRHAAARRVLAVSLWIMAFSLYDVFGYDFLVMTDSTAYSTMERMPELRTSYAAALNAYRILQVTFQIVLTTMVLYAAGKRAAIAALLAWWGGLCDLLYYAVTLRSLPAAWDWMWFTPAGFFLDVLPLWLVAAQAGALTIAAVWLLIQEPRDLRTSWTFLRRTGSQR
jgi:hypothetical protein